MIINSTEVKFSESSLFDNAGRVFFYQDRVFRAIYSKEFATIYSDLLSMDWITKVFEAGLVRTWISKDIFLEGALLTLEHEKLPFETHPAECTDYMHWLSAKVVVQTALEVSRHGYVLKDAHPWNIMFSRGFPRFIDFGSIVPNTSLLNSWLDEFKRYFAVPIWLASSKRWKHLAPEYRREHLNGFGLKLLSSTGLLHNMIMRELNKTKHINTNPELFFTKVNVWLEHHRPVEAMKGTWSDYEQSHETSPSKTQTAKQKFVYDILIRERPRKVLDCAANKGFYSEMAAKNGASVAAFDYEENTVNKCLMRAQREHLDITPVIMNFKTPTANYGIGLLGGNAIGRFKSDIVLALGLIHHLCIVQNLPVEVFCDICMRYAEKGIILEYVDSADKHVKEWNKPVPLGYTLDNICIIFKNKFNKMDKCDLITVDGICRYMLYFYNN